MPLTRSTGGRHRPWQSCQRPEGGETCHHWGPVSGLHLRPQSPQGLSKKKKRGHCNQAPYTVASLLWEHTHLAAAIAKCSGWRPDTWSLSLPKILQLGGAVAAPAAWAMWDRVLLAWSAAGRGKPPQLSLIAEVGVAHCHWSYLNKNHLQPHSPEGHHRGGHCDRTPPVGALATQEHTCPAAATAKKHPGQYPHA